MSERIEWRGFVWALVGFAVIVVGVIVVARITLSSAPEPYPPFTTQDSAGVPIVESRGPLESGGEAWRVGGEPILRIGVVEGDPVFQFSGVTGAVRLGNGTVVVADEGSEQVRFYDGDGEVQAVAGGSGEGPGEFTGLAALGTGPGDRVWAWDFALRRFTWLDSLGVVSGVISLGPEPPVLNPIGVLPDTTFVLKQLWGATQVAEATQTGLRRDRVAYVRFGPRGTLLDTLGLFPGREVYLTEEGGRGVMNTPPFARTSVGAIWDGGVAIGSQTSFEVGKYGPDGVLERVARIPDRDLSLGEDDVEAYIEGRLRGVDLEDQARFRQSLEAMPVPAERPAYGGFLADREGNLWIGEWAMYPDVPRRWTVLDPLGRWLGDVGMPEGFYPMNIGEDWVLGAERDELGVEYVATYPLLKGELTGGQEGQP